MPGRTTVGGSAKIGLGLSISLKSNPKNTWPPYILQQTFMQAYLVICHGARWTDVFRLQPEVKITIGRSSENQIVVRDDRVSRRHAEISHSTGGWAVRDLGSRNGTQVAGVRADGEQPLQAGDVVEVADCRMMFVTNLADAFGNPAIESSAISATQINLDQVTADLDEAPVILNRRKHSNWSQRGFKPTKDEADESAFFFRLISELVSSSSIETAAQTALDLLLERIEIGSGGVVLFGEPHERVSELPSMAVIAAKQLPGRAYHRVSDFLVGTILRDQQSVLARNIRDDAQLSLARQSGQRETSSMICAPLRDANGVIGLLHVYASLDERMLTELDLERAVGVADSLALTIVRHKQHEEIAKNLAQTKRQVDELKRELSHSSEMIGNSQAIEKVRREIARVAATRATVLVRGESGVGKELVARAIHFSSERCMGPLVCLNCAALAATLLESELFGHEKGAFTGATERKIGKFEAAHRGTLLLDEIGEMSLELQAKFLRALEGQPFERLGGSQSIQVDVRTIAATNRDLEQAVREKLFRADLYFRLRVVEIEIPPLRRRPDDIPVLAERFLHHFRQHASRRIVGFSPKALEKLCRHHWPGNVRELRNAIERAVVLGNGSTIEAEELGIAVLDSAMDQSALVEQRQGSGQLSTMTLDELEQQHIIGTLRATEGNKSQAAIALGIERSTLDRKLKRYNLSSRLWAQNG